MGKSTRLARSALMIRLYLATGLLLSLTSGDARAAAPKGGTASAPASSAGTIPGPSSGASGGTVDRRIALTHLEQMHNYLWSRWHNDFIDTAGVKLAARVQQLGVSDGDRAVALAGMADRAGEGTLIVNRFYGNNYVPLSKSVVTLMKKDAPSHVAKSDLDALDNEMKQLLQVEPKVLALADAAAELDAQAVAIEAKEFAINRQKTMVDTSFKIGTGFMIGPVPPTDSATRVSASTALANQLTPLQQQHAAIFEQEAKLLAQFSAMRTQFMTELGKSSGTPAGAQPAGQDTVPPDAVPD